MFCGMPTYLLVLCSWGTTCRDDPAAKPGLPVEEVRKVVSAIVGTAEQNVSRPGGPLKGDRLFDLYLRSAARTAREKKLSPRAFLLGIGVALDHTSFLRKNPLIRPYLVQIETDAERQKRLTVIGRPTLRQREDWSLHFSIAAALTAHLGPATAEQLSIAKEVLDAQGASGFSFADLAADYAGIGLANLLLGDQGEKQLARLAEAFQGNDFLPRLDDLEDGIPWEKFQGKYGSLSDSRFLKHCESIRTRVLKSPGFPANKD